MIPAVFLSCVLISAFLVFQRLRRSFLGRPWVLLAWAALLIAWAISPWAPPGIFDQDKQVAQLILVDVSESMGPSAADLLAKHHLPIENSDRLIVVAAGTTPVVCFDGNSRDYPDQLRPGVLPESPSFRLRSAMLLALKTGLSRVKSTEAAKVRVRSDGGFAPFRADAFLDDQARMKVLSGEEVPFEADTDSNLSVEFLGANPVFRPSVPLKFDVEIKGRIRVAKTIELKVEAEHDAPQTVKISLEAGIVNRRFRLSTGPLVANSTQLTAVLIGLGADDSRPEDNHDVLPLQASSRPPTVLIIEGPEATPIKTSDLQDLVLTKDPSALNLADVVIVNDVSMKSGMVDSAFWPALQKNVELGTGLLLVGARSSFGLGHWDNTVLDSLSPLKARPGTKKRVLIIAIDRSGSMEKNARFQRAAAVVNATFDRMKQGDRLVLLLFGADFTKSTYERGQGDARARLAEELQGVRPTGGTHLSPVMQALAETPVAEDEESLAILLSDGRDPESMTPANVAKWRSAMDQRQIDFRFFWFDRESTLRPLLMQLVQSQNALVEVDDFAALRRPFFQAVDEKLTVIDGKYRHENAGQIKLKKVLRTRLDPQAQVHVQGAEGAHALATIRRGLGLVGAAPVALGVAQDTGLFPGDRTLLSFVKSLAPSTSQRFGSLQAVVENGVAFVELSGWSGVVDGLQLRFGSSEVLKLDQVGPGRFRSAAMKELPRSTSAQLLSKKDSVLARLPFRSLRPTDLGPSPRLGNTSDLVAALTSIAKTASKKPTAHLALLALALLLLTAEMILRISSKS
ncbi:MAG: hypothetical protein ACI97A_000467 [Planctomycetota bacterium]